MTQQIINTGAVANDGTGESLRNAFNAVNENFTQIWASGPVDSQVVITNNRISTDQTNLDLVLAGNGIGNVAVASTIVPTINSVYDLGSPTRYFDSTYSQYFYGNGRFLTGINSSSGGGNVTFSMAPPSDPAVGDIWIESDTGVQYLYFNDDTSSQWAEMEAYISFSSANSGGNINLTDIQSNVLPSVSNTYQLGTASQQWKTLYVNGNTVFIANTPVTITSGVMSVNGSNVLTEGTPLTFTNLTVSSNLTVGNSVTIANRATIGNIYSDHYYYANGVPFGQGGGNLGNSVVTAKENVLSVSVLNEDLVLAGNGVGNVAVSSSIVPLVDSVHDLGSTTEYFNSTYSQYFYGNGRFLTGVESTPVNTGNWAFLANTLYNPNGGYINNSDLSHGATAYLSIPANGNTSPVSILNYYGNFVVTTANAPGFTKSWTFDNTGNITLPTNAANINYANGVSILNGSGSGNVDFTAVASNIIPTGNSVYNLGNAAHQWGSLYLSNATIYMNGTPIGLTAGNVLTVNGADVVTTNSESVANIGNLQVNGATIALVSGASQTQVEISPNGESWAYLQIPNDATGNVANVRLHNDAGNIEIAAGDATHGGAVKYWYFDKTGTLVLPNNANITTVDNTVTQINSVATANGAINLRTFDANGNIGASTYFDGASGSLDFYSYNYTTDTSYNWRFDNGGSFTLPTAPGNVYFGEDANQPVIIPYGTGLYISANRANAEASYINIDQNGLILLTPGSIQIDNSSATSLGNDINLLSGDDIRLSGRNKPNDTENEGGDINIYAGQGADSVTEGFDTGGGGDIQIGGGAGGSDAGGGFGASAGGFVNITGGDGGTSSTTNVGSGGTVTIRAGSAGSTGNTALGGWGGGVNINAGRTTRTNENGGSIEITAGEASGDGTGIAGYVAINIPTSATAIGGTWTFGGTGTTLNVPANAEIYGANFGNMTVGCAGNTIITSSDYGANVKNWVFGYTGTLGLPGITTTTGAEAMTIAGTRTLVGGFDNPNGAYAATFSGSSPVAVYSCDINTYSAKVTFAIQTNYATFGWEQFDVSVIKLQAGGVGVTVSNRMNGSPANGDTQVTANIGGSNEIVISLAQPGTGTAYVNYTAVEFKLPVD